MQRNVCPNCGSTNIVTDEKTGEVYCANCGLVLYK
ncbi:MAG: TFIIB-type zinc ribbon-containing protein, partial [Thermoproteota archaeon]